jgi:hypothetical protein
MNQSETAPTPAPNKKQNNGNIWKITALVTTIIAICGVSFGVYEITQTARTNCLVPNSNAQQNNGNETNATTETPTKDEIGAAAETPAEQEGQTTTPEAAQGNSNSDTNSNIPTTPAGSSVTSGPYIANNYFYVPKWGVKYKLSDNLTNYGYAVDQSHQGDNYGNYVVGLTAIMKKDYVKSPVKGYYHDIFSCSVVTVRTIEKNIKVNDAIKFDDKEFVIHDTWRDWNCSNKEAYTNGYVSTDEASKELIKVLSNPEKI